jgi:hypothetical protein
MADQTEPASWGPQAAEFIRSMIRHEADVMNHRYHLAGVDILTALRIAIADFCACVLAKSSGRSNRLWAWTTSLSPAFTIPAILIGAWLGIATLERHHLTQISENSCVQGYPSAPQVPGAD